MKQVSDKGKDMVVQEIWKYFRRFKEKTCIEISQLIISKECQTGKIVKNLEGLFDFHLGFEVLRFKR